MIMPMLPLKFRHVNISPVAITHITAFPGPSFIIYPGAGPKFPHPCRFSFKKTQEENGTCAWKKYFDISTVVFLTAGVITCEQEGCPRRIPVDANLLRSGSVVEGNCYAFSNRR
jgi:hypothetical protein